MELYKEVQSCWDCPLFRDACVLLVRGIKEKSNRKISLKLKNECENCPLITAVKEGKVEVAEMFSCPECALRWLVVKSETDKTITNCLDCAEKTKGTLITAIKET